MQTSQSEQKPLDNTAKKSCWLIGWWLLSANTLDPCCCECCFVLLLFCFLLQPPTLIIIVAWHFLLKVSKDLAHDWYFLIREGLSLPSGWAAANNSAAILFLIQWIYVQVSKSSQKGNFNIHDRSLSHDASLILYHVKS